MRSVFVHLTGVTKRELKSALSNRYPGQSDPWIMSSDNGDPVLYIRLEDNRDVEAEPSVREAIVQALGGPPSASLVADVSGRHPGPDEVRDFVRWALSEFSGVAQDDYTPHVWPLKDVLDGSLREGHSFFDYEGWYKEFRDRERERRGE